MTIIDYVLAQADACAKAAERAVGSGIRNAAHTAVRNRISIAGDLGGRAYTQRDARRKWARAA